MTDSFALFLLALVAVGSFCSGGLYEMRKRMQIWQKGFDEAKRIYSAQ